MSLIAGRLGSAPQTQQVADFGNSRAIKSRKLGRGGPGASGAGALMDNLDGDDGGGVGTPIFAAPEVRLLLADVTSFSTFAVARMSSTYE